MITKQRILNVSSLLGMMTAVFFSSLSASASINFDEIKFWAGTGENRAALVIDWNDNTGTEALVWGFRWDGTATGTDMITAIDAADSCLTVDGTTSTYGYFVNRIRYAGNDQTHDQNTPEDWSQSWSYWTSDSGTSWTSSMVGSSSRTLSNNSWDGWSFTAWDEYYNPVTAPSNPVTAVPEPATLGLLAMGMLGFIRKRRTL
jgi:hypothetical protein